MISEDETDHSHLYQNIFYRFIPKLAGHSTQHQHVWRPLTKLSCRTLVKRVEVGLSVQQVEEETVEEIMVQGGAVSPIVTIEPRRRKFHKAITITMPLPERMSAQYLRRRQNESLKLSQKQQGKTPIGSFFDTAYVFTTLISCSLDPATNFESTNYDFSRIF